MELVKINPAMSKIKIVPNADYQRQNASLALALVQVVIENLDKRSLTDEDMDTVVKDGLEQTVWRGRCEIKMDGCRRWYLDGAHTTDSLKVAARWFAGEAKKRPAPAILIFNQQSRPEALEIQTHFGLQFHHVIFSTNVTRSTGYRTGK